MMYTDGIHLVSDVSIEELHAFAASIGIKRGWYHSGSDWPHYDIPKKMRADFAAKHGVKLVSSKEIVQILKQAGLKKS